MSLKRFITITPRVISVITSNFTPVVKPVLRNARLLNSCRAFSTFRPLYQENTENKQDQAKEQPNEAKESTEQQKPKQEDNVATLQKQLEESAKKLKDFEHKYLSSLADAQNVRRIAKTDVDNSKKFGISKFAEALLEVVDNLGRALTVIKDEDIKHLVKVVSESNVDQKTKQTAQLLGTALEGVRMTDKVLIKTLENNQVKKMTGIEGSEFDPKYHDAIAKLPVKDKKPNTVLNVVKEGFTIHDRVLRPAQVVVVVEEQS
jgi:molecular chaperone GrpE